MAKMLILTSQLCALRYACKITLCSKVIKRTYKIKTTDVHPYKRIHPWKSIIEFSDDLLNNMIYNKNGLVVLNKPYGIRRSNNMVIGNQILHVANGVNYTLQDALPYISDKLNYPSLTVFRSPEMYMSGITLLAENTDVMNAIKCAYARAEFYTNTYWVITVRVPRKPEDNFHLGIKSISNDSFKQRKNVLVSNWSKNEAKKYRIKLFKTEYKVLSKSILDLCSLIKLKASTHNKHAIRLFASLYLYCPVLGDDIYANYIRNIAGTYTRMDPVSTNCNPPTLDEKLLQLLNVNCKQQRIIPTHIHLKSTTLPKFFGETLTFDAPLMPYFKWTCNQLEIEHVTNNCDQLNSCIALK